MREAERINKSVLTVNSIECKNWSLAEKDNPVLCYYCKSPLFYVRINWGIVEEEELLGIKIQGKKKKPYYSLREIGLALFCAECGNFHEDYFRYFYPEDKIVCSWDDEELDFAEIEEIRYCLEQFNKKGNFIPRYSCSETFYLKKKLKEYEEKYYKKSTKKSK